MRYLLECFTEAFVPGQILASFLLLMGSIWGASDTNKKAKCCSLDANTKGLGSILIRDSKFNPRGLLERHPAGGKI